VDKLTIEFRSFGIKTGTIPKADCYIDCRGVPDPVNRIVTKDSPSDAEWIRNSIDVMVYIRLIEDHLWYLSKRRGDKLFSRPFVILCMCAWGKHRSPAMKRILAEQLSLLYGDLYLIEVR